jgi:hypothetical protein
MGDLLFRRAALAAIGAAALWAALLVLLTEAAYFVASGHFLRATKIPCRRVRRSIYDGCVATRSVSAIPDRFLQSLWPRQTLEWARTHRVGRTMAAYRCYLLGADARIAALETLDCGDDEEASQLAEAIAKARQYLKAEVWDRDRLVARIGRPNVREGADELSAPDDALSVQSAREAAQTQGQIARRGRSQPKNPADFF